jgi:hypothetical protein
MVALVGGWVKCLEEGDRSTPFYGRITPAGKIIAILILGLTILTFYLNNQEQANQELRLKEISRLTEVNKALIDVDEKFENRIQDMKMIAEDATQLRAYTTKDLDRKTGGIVKIDFNKHLEKLGKLFTLLERAQNLVEKAPENSLDTLKKTLGHLVKLSADQENELLTKLRNIEAPPSVTNATIVVRK